MARILFVATSTTVGGAEKTLYTLATRLGPGEFQVAGVVGLKVPGYYSQRLDREGVKTRSLGMIGWPSWREVAALARIIAETKPDLVHALMYQAIQLCRFAERRSAVPFRLVSSPRVNYRSRSRLSLLADRWLRSADDLLISESDASRDFLLRLGYAPDRVRTVRNGVDLPEIPSAAERRRARLQLGLREDEPLLLAMGRLDEQKGHSVLLDAAARLKGPNRPRCAVVGDGPLRDRLRRQAARLGLERAVQLPGERADVRAWMNAADVFVLPSLWEGLPNALLEAMALGLPVAASRVDGVPEAVTDGTDGLLVEPADPGALAAALGSLLADPDLRRRLGAAARARVAADFTVPAMLTGYKAAYRDVLALPA
ncbi:MAG: glycosyltransferase [Elusimicrobia bacterium]|nr:glycosyltransferase [Elusimicrobiota bacterium]